MSFAVDAELELRRRRKSGTMLEAPQQWEQWCPTLFPVAFSKPFACRHVEMWEWIETIVPGYKPPAFLGIWGRGGAKSTNAETAVIRLGAKGARKFGLYVSSTQLKADGHVSSVAGKIESVTFAQYYRKMSKRAINQYGASKGWRRELLRCGNGFTLQSFGLDTGMRGIKVDDYRPDFIVLDDVDELHESLPVILKKERVITDSILPSGSSDCAILFIQNLIHPDSIASRLMDGRADFLRNRVVSGPHPAIENFSYEVRGDGKFYITGGTATWEGQSLEVCQTQMNDWGISAFNRESQHDVDISGGLWEHIDFNLLHVTYDEIVKYIVDVEVWVDPAVTETDNSDCMGISAGAKLLNFRHIPSSLAGLYWWEHITSPEDALKRAIRVALQYGSLSVGVETDQGGDTWRSVYKLACEEVKKEMENEWIREWMSQNKGRTETDAREKMPEFAMPKFKSDKAGSGHGSKRERNQRMLADYETGRVFHCTGTHSTIEKALKRFPNPPLDVADSFYYVWYYTIGKNRARLRVA